MKYIKGLIVVLIAAVLVVGAVRLVKKKKAEEAKIEAAKTYKIAVDFMKLKSKKFTLGLPYLATVEGDNRAVVSTKVAGRILKIVKSGERVKKGDVLVRIDDGELKSKLEALKLSINSIRINLSAKKIVLKNALLTHKRTKELLDVKGASIEQYQNEEDKITLLKAAIASLKSSMAINRAKMDEIKNLISYTVIKAPFDGVISKANATVSDMAMPGKPLLFLQALKGNYLVAALPNSIKAKEVVYNGKSYPLISLHSTVNGLEKYKVTANVKESIGSRVDIKVKTFDGEAVFLPLNALLQIGGKSYIFVIDKDVAKPVSVKLLADGEEGYAIDKKYEGKKVALAKPDIFLKLLAGTKIKLGVKN